MQITHTRTAQRAIKTAAILLAAAVVILLWRNVVSEIAGIFFGACVLAFLLTPLSRLLEKKLSRPLAALLSLLGAVLALLGIISFLLPAFIRQFSSLFEMLPDAFERIRNLAEALGDQLQRRLPGLSLPKINLSSMENSLSTLAMGAVNTVSSVADGVYRLFLMAALSYFLIADRERMLLRLELLVPSAWRRLAVRAGYMLMRELRLYLRGQATIALAVALLAVLGLSLIGVKSAPLLGIIVGMFNVIPYLGPFLGGIPAVIMALSIGWQQAALVIALLFLVQQIDGMVISPRVMGNVTGFSPAVVLLAIFVGAQIGNIGGMLFALPSLMTIRTLYRVFVQRHEKN